MSGHYLKPNQEIKPTRLYAVEFLRVWFIACIMLFHMYIMPGTLRNDLMRLFHSSGLGLERAVMFFFIIGGFFLYRKLALGVNSGYEAIKKIYLRLLPVTLFALFVLVPLREVSIPNITLSIFQLNGTGLSKSGAMGWGDWFIGVYFWTSCLLIGVFQLKTNSRWLVFGILMYICFILRIRTSYIPEAGLADGQHLYYGLISSGMAYGISCMSVGMISGFLSDKIVLPNKCSVKVVFTIFEIACLVCIYRYMFETQNCRMGYLEMTSVMGAFMISISHSYGYISRFLNKLSGIQYVSRYTLPTLFGHIICLHMLWRIHIFIHNEYLDLAFVIGGGIVLGIFEYHIVERWFISKFKTFFLR